MIGWIVEPHVHLQERGTLLIPTGSITITVGGITHAAIIEADGSFASSFATGSLVPVNPAYVITYAYGGDTNFKPTSGAGTLTVT